MAPGDKELMKAFEETITRNVLAAVDHGNETRRLVRELGLKVEHLEAQLVEKDKKLSSQKWKKF